MHEAKTGFGFCFVPHSIAIMKNLVIKFPSKTTITKAFQ